MGLLAVGVGCAGADTLVREGRYQRTSYVVLDRAGKKLRGIDDISAMLPRAVRLLPHREYEIDAGPTRIRGAYRLEGDSIFFEDGGTATRTVSVFGTSSGDTLSLRMPALLLVLGGEPGMDLQLNFVRAKP